MTYLGRVTTDRAEVERSREEVAEKCYAEGDKTPPLPLRLRLQKAKEVRRISLRALGEALGVSAVAVGHWLRGAEDGGKPIPEGRVQAIIHWIEGA